MFSKDGVILLPSYQPEETLINLSRGLSLEGFFVLIVDDGSGPDYQHIFEACKKYATVIDYEKNQGKGNALKYGFKYCLDNLKDYHYVVTADGDGQHRIDDISRVYERCKKQNVSVIGVRKFDVKVPIKSKIGNKLSKFNQSLVTNRYMHDNQCGLRGFPYSILPDMLNIFGSRYEYEMNVLTFLQVKELPFQCLRIQTIYENNNSGSHFRPIADTLRIQGSILLYGLINILLFIALANANFFVFKYVDFGLPINLEVSTSLCFGGYLLAMIIIKLIVYRPKYPAKLVLRVVLYELLKFIALLVSVTLFVRVLLLNIFLTYLICYVLTLLPRYYLVKGIGLVYDANINDEI